MHYLGIDVGTSGTKALLIDDAGKVVLSASASYGMDTPQNGWAEQHPDIWWNSAVSVIRQITTQVNPAEIAAVGLTGQMHGLVILDENDQVIRPAILWCDQRTEAECAEINDIIGEDNHIKITANPPLTGFTSPKILWVKKHEPQNYAKIAKIMLPKDYIRFKLTGDNACDVSDASGTGLLNVSKRAWSAEICSKLGIDIRFLGKLYESCEISGKVHSTFASETGLSIGTPVTAGAGDNAAAAIGTGVAFDGSSFITIGSSGVVFTHTKNINIDPNGRVHSFCAAVSGEWHNMGVSLAAGMSVSWLRDNFMPELSFTELTALAEASTTAGNRLLFLPYLNGERTPHKDPSARGVFFGLSSSHTRGDLARAVIESICYSAKDSVNIINGMNQDAQIKSIIACGGGSSFAFTRQTLADVLGIPVIPAPNTDGPALGAAILAAVSVRRFASVPEASAEWIQPDESLQSVPDIELHKKYREYHALYGKLYSSLKNNFVELARL